ncbi:MAG: endolytic transglycosylase MltG [Thermoleophilaceae bacterium]|nr:endolytic transglycosylase MltG [Thermoleophilaceae bacterium]
MPDRSPEERARARLERQARRTGDTPPTGEIDAAPDAVPPPGARPSSPFFRGGSTEPPPPPPPPPPSAGPVPPPEPIEPAPKPVNPVMPLPPPPVRPLPQPASSPAAPVGSGPPGSGSIRARRVPLLIVAAVAAVVAILVVLIYQPGADAGGDPIPVQIPEESGVGEIAALLGDQGVIGNPFFFEVRATLDGRRGDLRPGEFELAQGMSYGAALDVLTTEPEVAEEPQQAGEPVTITIPEGQSRTEIAEIVEEAGLDGDYVEATKKSKDFDPAKYDAKNVENLEGFLWPATYELRTGDSVDKLVEQQLQAFEDNIAGVDLEPAEKKFNLTPFDVINIASMIEREAILDDERPIVSSVIYNRLRDSIPLGIDATIRFATGNWTEPLKESELAIESPYNTRLNQGLPPGPIGNPGLASLEAAAKPDKTDFLYYVVKPDSDGAHAFAETDEQFQQDVQKYNSAREAAGGKAP